MILGNTGLWNWIELFEAIWLLRLAETTPPQLFKQKLHAAPLRQPRPLPTHSKEALKMQLAILPHLSIFCYVTIPFTLLWRKNPHKRDGARGPPDPPQLHWEEHHLSKKESHKWISTYEVILFTIPHPLFTLIQMEVVIFRSWGRLIDAGEEIGNFCNTPIFAPQNLATKRP